MVGLQYTNIHIHMLVDDVPVAEESRPPRVATEPRRTYLKARDYVQAVWGARPHSAKCRNRMEEILKCADDPRYRRYKEQAGQAVFRHDASNLLSHAHCARRNMGPSGASAETVAAAPEGRVVSRLYMGRAESVAQPQRTYGLLSSDSRS